MSNEKEKHDLNTFISALNYLTERLEYLKEKYGDTELLENSVQQIAFCYGFMFEKNLFPEYLEYIPNIEKQYKDFQVIMAHHREVKDL